MEMKITSPKYGKYYIKYDKEDEEVISKYSWHVNMDKSIGKPYVVAHTYKKGKRTCIRMHRLIMGAPENMQVDHINQDTTDNRRHNLRVCTNQQNSMNRGSRKNSLYSSYKGVCFHKRVKKWTAQIYKDKKNICIGYFKTEKDAAIAYNKKAKEIFGDFAYINEV